MSTNKLQALADANADAMETLRTTLVRRRIAMGLTPNDVATRLDMTVGQVLDIERYDYVPRIDELGEYVLALGGVLHIDITFDDLDTSSITSHTKES